MDILIFLAQNRLSNILSYCTFRFLFHFTDKRMNNDAQSGIRAKVVHQICRRPQGRICWRPSAFTSASQLERSTWSQCANSVWETKRCVRHEGRREGVVTSHRMNYASAECVWRLAAVGSRTFWRTCYGKGEGKWDLLMR